MLVAAVAGYGRRAYAACDPIGGATYQCSGANVVQQTINANNASVSTVAGFSVNTPDPFAIRITGDGALSYTDTNASPLTGYGGFGGYGLYVRSGANFAGTPGSVTIATNGALSGGGSGIYARNLGTGALTVTANGDVTGIIASGINARTYGTDLTVTTGVGTTASGAVGINARNFGAGALTITANGNVTGTVGTGINAYSAAGTALSVTTGAGTIVSGGTGIYANNKGTGSVTITANGNVTGTSSNGIYAQNVNGTDLTVTTGAGTAVSGTYGILARNFGTGATTITANGDVTGTNGAGISARNNNVNGTALSVTTGVGTTVSGTFVGIYARNYGTGATTITANGDVTGANYGIRASNSAAGTALSVTTGVGTTVNGTFIGMYARNYGTGALTIAANGAVSGTTGYGILAQNTSGTDLTVTTGAGTMVSGTSGIFARNSGTGALAITANGDVTGTPGRGIDAYNSGAGTGLTVTTGAGTAVSGTSGIFARNFGTGALTITANGNATGTNAYGISARNDVNSTALTVTTAAGTTVSGATDGINARNLGTGELTVTANGTVTGTTGINIAAGAATVTVGGAGVATGSGGTAIQFANATNRLELVTGAVINGNVRGGTGTDTLGLSGTSSGSFNVGQLTSFAAGQKTGSGTWTLTGTNTGITAFSVAGGTLAVNGSLANAAMTVNSGAMLSGTGTVGNTLVSGGTFAPGSGAPGSSLNVTGTLGLNATSTFAVNVNPTTSSFATVSGAATLGNATLNAIFANGSYIARQYTILNAGSISGTFGAVTNTNLPANFASALSYDATHAYLDLTLSFVAPPTSGLNGNQSNVGNALTNYFNTTGGIPLVYGGLTANGLSQASGQPGASTAQSGFAGVGQFANSVFDGAFDGDSGQGGAIGFAQVDRDDMANAYAPKKKVAREAANAFAKVMPVKDASTSFDARWNVWATAYGGNSRVNGDTGAGTNTTTSRIFGTAVGATYRFTPDTQAGFALGGAGSSFDVAGGFGGGKADVFNAAVYAKHNFGAAYVAGLLGYSWQDTTTDRTVTIAGTDQLRANFKAQALSARLEGGWRYATAMVGITPYAALQSTSFYLPSYGETVTSGSGAFALNYASKTITATRGELGAKFDKAMLVQGGVFTLKAKTAWAHDWNTDRATTATFQALPGATFTVNGAQPSANAALLSLGAEMKWHNGWSLAGSFDGEFSRTTAAYAGKGTVKYAW